jgi:hypothetical protein
VHYRVTEYEPGRLVRFGLTAPVRMEGEHRFEVDANVPRHVLDARARGRVRLTWPLFYGPLHDALLVDVLDKAQASLAGRDWRPRPLTLRVRLLRGLSGLLRR